MRNKLYIIIGLALIYTLAAQAGFALSLLREWHATLVWPASGIAVAALLLFGRDALWGVFLGALVTNLMTFSSTLTPSLVCVALAIATGSTLAALAAARGLLFTAPNAPKSVTAGQLFQGSCAILLASGIAAIVGVGSLHLAGIVPADVFTVTLSMWWLGDFCGIMIFGPAVWLVARRLLAPQEKMKFAPVITALAVNSAFVAMALMLFLTLWYSETSAIKSLLAREAANAARNVQQKLEETGNNLGAIRALFYASNNVEAQEFRRYVNAEAVIQQQAGYQAVGWAPRVTNPAAWVQSVRVEAASSGARLQLFERDNSGQRVPVSQRDDYFPVQYIEPPEGNKAAVGFDLGSEKKRRGALDRSRDSGEVSLVAPIQLIQSQDIVPALLMCAPIYQPDVVLDSVAARRANLSGFASAVFLIAPLFFDALKNVDALIDIDFHLFDRNQPANTARYSTKASSFWPRDWQPSPDATLASLTERENGLAQINFADHVWVVVATPGPTFFQTQRSWTPWGALLLTLALGLVASSILLERIAAQINFNLQRAKTEEAVRQAIAANESKAYFMTAASHDIKQPLYALGMLTDTLLMSNPAAGSVPILDHLRTSISQMTDHFDALIDAGKFQDGNFEVKLCRVDLKEIAASIDSEIAPLCARKGITWKLDMDSVQLHTDPDLLLRLLRNLLSNALRNTDEGTVSCSATVLGNVVEFQISDTGCGIAPEHQQAVWEDFVRVDKDGARSTGTGLGLSIVAKIALALDLNIKMSSRLGQGTDFTFRVALASPA